VLIAQQPKLLAETMVIKFFTTTTLYCITEFLFVDSYYLFFSQLHPSLHQLILSNLQMKMLVTARSSEKIVYYLDESIDWYCAAV